MENANVASIETRLSWRDYFGMFKMRIGIGRNKYRAAPGLYKTGTPKPDSPVFVSANYKMSFDLLRSNLAGIDAWILVLNTRGVNVWCAAGKGTFSTRELVKMIKKVELETFVSHRELILPQLSAPGVAAHEVMKNSGFKVKFGPIRAGDIKRFIDNGKVADAEMREVTFSLWERFVLTPNELASRLKVSFLIIAAILVISNIGNGLFSFHWELYRGIFGSAAYIIGLLSGAVIAPLFLPWLPGRSFAAKGALTGLVLSTLFCLFIHEQLGFMSVAAILIFASSVSSYVALTFTGATPFTSPTGVEKEMRLAIPIQIAAVVLSCALWIARH
ncbi:MAG: hypothetical protein HYY43_02525 [Deltaproteobacteria bacterium]|nr:hypothetical protein [Deltaproteobacteria bacterium]MBI2974449.1 hypothetical protein [Deltaproteobacteria bacterium]